MDTRWQGDYRPNGEFAKLRTVCHGCRQLTHVHVEGDDGVSRLRPMVMPGDGSITVEVAPGYMVAAPCPVCGESDDPGWVPGLRAPA